MGRRQHGRSVARVPGRRSGGHQPVGRYDDTGLVTGREYSYQVQLSGPRHRRRRGCRAPCRRPCGDTPGVLSPIGRLVRDMGSSSGILGPVTCAERAVPGGRMQDHQNGQILQLDGGTPFAVTGSFHAVFIAAGGMTGHLGFPVTRAGGRPAGRRARVQLFEGGSIWGPPPPRSVVVPDVMEDGWAASGWEEGPLGYPVSEPVRCPRRDHGRSSRAAPSTGAQPPVPTAWAGADPGAATRGSRAGGTAGSGYPTTDEICGLGGGGCCPGVPGRLDLLVPRPPVPTSSAARIRDPWSRRGGEDGRLGYPTSGDNCGLPRRRLLPAVPGRLHLLVPRHRRPPRPRLDPHAWAARDAESGKLGYPTTGEICGLRGGGCFQLFQGGAIYWSPGTGAHVVLGAIRDTWARQRLGGRQARLPHRRRRSAGCARRLLPAVPGRHRTVAAGGARRPAAPSATPGAARAGRPAACGYPAHQRDLRAPRAAAVSSCSRAASIYWSPATGAHLVLGGHPRHLGPPGLAGRPARLPRSPKRVARTREGAASSCSRAAPLARGPRPPGPTRSSADPRHAGAARAGRPGGWATPRRRVLRRRLPAELPGRHRSRSLGHGSQIAYR